LKLPTDYLLALIGHADPGGSAIRLSAAERLRFHVILSARRSSTIPQFDDKFHDYELWYVGQPTQHSRFGNAIHNVGSARVMVARIRGRAKGKKIGESGLCANRLPQNQKPAAPHREIRSFANRSYVGKLTQLIYRPIRKVAVACPKLAERRAAVSFVWFLRKVAVGTRLCRLTSKISCASSDAR
jgi:hypothetical protein